jgi:hypothetical protein
MNQSLVSVVNWVAVNTPCPAIEGSACSTYDDAFIGILVRFTPLAGDALIIGDALNRGQLVIFRTGLNSFYWQGDFKVLVHDR